MKYAKYLFLILGFALLARIAAQVEWQQVYTDLAKVGWRGFALVLALHVVTFWTDVAGWQLTFNSIPLSGLWNARLYAVRQAGEAFNYILPAASVGGEPLKAALLKTHYRVAYREAAATQLLSRTINTIALLIFVAIGFVFLVNSSDFPHSMKWLAAIGLGGVTIGTLFFVLMQWFKLSSVISRRLSRTRFGRWLENVVHIVEEFDEHMVSFYRSNHARFAAALALGFINWVLGALEVYMVLGFIGFPIDFADAWIIEALAQLMRAAAFLIPAAVGVQEGTFLVACRAITGIEATGVAMSVVRRVRELLWVFIGLLLYWTYSTHKPADANGYTSQT